MNTEQEEERYSLALARIGQIYSDNSVPVIYRDFFEKEAAFLVRMDVLAKNSAPGNFGTFR